MPVKICSIVRAYCTQIGLSNPHWMRMSLISCGVASRPASRSAGSPSGITWKIRNVSAEIANSTRTIETSRRSAKISIG